MIVPESTPAGPVRRLTGALLLGVVALLAACSGSGGPPTSQPPPGEPVPPATPVGSWSVVGSVPNGGVSSATCPSEDSCLAPSPGRYLQWTGSRWTPVAIPWREDALAIDCPERDRCLRSASIGDEPVLERWDGTSWSPVPLPPAPGLEGLGELECPTPTTCFVMAGGRRPGTPATDRADTFLYRLDGTTWTDVSPPTAVTRPFDELHLSCATVSFCALVGIDEWGSQGFVNGTAVVLHWNGTSWSGASPLPSVPGAVHSGYVDVVCTAANACIAAGQARDADGPYALQLAVWDGRAWRRSTLPDLGPEPMAQPMLSCGSPTRCLVAVKKQLIVDGIVTHEQVVLSWDGAQWRHAPALPPDARSEAFPDAPPSVGDLACFPTSCLVQTGAMLRFTR